MNPENKDDGAESGWAAALQAVRTTLNNHYRQNNAECECEHTMKPEHLPFRQRIKELLESECDYQVVEFPSDRSHLMRISWYHDGYSDCWSDE